jgi:AraC-like DNA-binding protein
MRQLGRIIRRDFGMPPKQVMRRARALDMASHLHGVADEAEAEELILRYFDQAQMTREFTELFGVTPRRFVKTPNPLLTLALDRARPNGWRRWNACRRAAAAHGNRQKAGRTWSVARLILRATNARSLSVEQARHRAFIRNTTDRFTNQRRDGQERILSDFWVSSVGRIVSVMTSSLSAELLTRDTAAPDRTPWVI